MHQPIDGLCNPLTSAGSVASLVRVQLYLDTQLRTLGTNHGMMWPVIYGFIYLYCCGSWAAWCHELFVGT